MLKLLLMSLIVAHTAWSSFSVEPFVLVLNANKGGTSGFLTIKTNQSFKPVPVELELFERTVDEYGVETDEAVESDDLIIYPSQVVVFPNEPVRVQVSWAGKTFPNIDKVYILQATEVPVNLNTTEEKFNKATGGVSSVVRYRAVIAVETGKSGKLNVKSIKLASSGKKVEIIVENSGEGRVPTDGMFIMLKGVKYNDFDKSGGNSIMPYEKRTFLLDVPFLPNKSDIQFGY